MDSDSSSFASFQYLESDIFNQSQDNDDNLVLCIFPEHVEYCFVVLNLDTCDFSFEIDGHHIDCCMFDPTNSPVDGGTPRDLSDRDICYLQ